MRHKIISIFIICAMLLGMCNISYAEEQSVENEGNSDESATISLGTVSSPGSLNSRLIFGSVSKEMEEE